MPVATGASSVTPVPDRHGATSPDDAPAARRGTVAGTGRALGIGASAVGCYQSASFPGRSLAHPSPPGIMGWSDVRMRPEHCVTRNHIEVWNGRVLPAGAVRVAFWTVLRGSLLPVLVWGGVISFVFFIHSQWAAVALGGLFAFSFLLAFALRRRARHSLRCSLYGAVGGVLDMSLAGL